MAHNYALSKAQFIFHPGQTTLNDRVQIVMRVELVSAVACLATAMYSIIPWQWPKTAGTLNLCVYLNS